MIKGISAGLVLTLAGGASGQASLTLAVRLSVDGVNWSPHLFVLPGSTVQVGIWATGTGADYYGMGGATLRMRVVGAEVGDTMEFAAGTSTGRVSPFNFGAATNAIFRDAPSEFRIDAASDGSNSNTAAGLTFFQRDPATATPGTFSTTNPALVFRCDFRMGAGDTVGGQTFMLDQLTRGVAGYFSAANSSRQTLTSDVQLVGAAIGPLPAPGAVGVFGVLGVAVAARRRRVG